MNTISREGADASEQPARESNIRALVAYFESGIKERKGEIGIELEHTLVRSGNQAVSYHEEHGTEWVLERLLESHPQAIYDAEGDLLGVARTREAVTLEPAAQIELSAGPFPTLDDARQCFDSFEAQLERILAPEGIRALTIGYHPTATAKSLALIPKQRYAFMDRYFEAIGPFGACMMRGSASTQVSIDYSSVEDCLRKLRLAYALAPLLALICDNSPLFEDAPRTHHMMRTEIWQECDPDRCGVVPGALSPDFTLSDYAEYLLDTPAILVSDERGQWRYTGQTFGSIYANRTMTQSDIEHAVSMLFNDVRLKTYIELRPADAMPIPYVIAYAGLVKGLFSSEQSLCALERLLANVSEADVEAAKESLMASGYDAKVYGATAEHLADSIVRIALAGLNPQEKHHIQPLADLVAQRTTLACLAEQRLKAC